MRFEGFMSQDKLVDELYQAPTLTDPEARPYGGAEISIEEVPIGDFHPTQLYYIGDNLSQQRIIRNFLIPHGEDTLRMKNGGIVMTVADGRTEVMIPPIVEDCVDYGLVLVDGTHRTQLAVQMGRKVIVAVLIRSVSPEYAVTNRGLPNEWGDMRYFPTVDELKAARKEGFLHRIPGTAPPEERNNAYRSFLHITGRGKDERK